jgi:hypothetical protein
VRGLLTPAPVIFMTQAIILARHCYCFKHVSPSSTRPHCTRIHIMLLPFPDMILKIPLPAAAAAAALGSGSTATPPEEPPVASVTADSSTKRNSPSPSAAARLLASEAPSVTSPEFARTLQNDGL